MNTSSYSLKAGSITYDQMASMEPLKESTKKAFKAAAAKPRSDKEYQHDVATRMGKRSANRMWSDPAALERVLESGKNRRTVWTVSTSPFPGAHFAVFPQELIEPCVLIGCPPDGLVLDPFVGSGTALLVAKRTGRRGIGIDVKPEYLDMAVGRLL